MAAFVNTSLKSVTIEDAMLELSERLAIIEATPSSNPDGLDNIQVSYSADNVVNISFSATIAKTLDADGKVVVSVTEYLT